MIQLALHEAVIDTFSNEDTQISSLPECADFNEVETSDESEEEFQTTEDPPLLRILQPFSAVLSCYKNHQLFSYWD